MMETPRTGRLNLNQHQYTRHALFIRQVQMTGGAHHVVIRRYSYPVLSSIITPKMERRSQDNVLYT